MACHLVLLLLLAPLGAQCSDTSTDDFSILQQHFRSADTVASLESRLEERLNAMEQRLLAWETVASQAQQRIQQPAPLAAEAQQPAPLGAELRRALLADPFHANSPDAVTSERNAYTDGASGSSPPQTASPFHQIQEAEQITGGTDAPWWRKVRSYGAKKSREPECPHLATMLEGRTVCEHIGDMTDMIRELRDEVERLVANTGQEQFHEEEVQSRQDQLEAQFAEQGQTLQRLDNGVHELERSLQRESVMLNGMGKSVLAMNNSLRASVTRNSQEIGVLFKNQEEDETQLAHTSQMMNGLADTQHQDELKLSTHEGSINKLGQVQLEDETKLGQTARQVMTMMMQVEHVNKSQDHMRLDFAVAEHNLQHQSLSLEKLAANISGLDARLHEVQTEFAGALRTHGAEILQNKESVDTVDEEVSVLKTAREKDVEKLLDLSQKHQDLALNLDKVRLKQNKEMSAVNETVGSIVNALKEAGEVMSSLNKTQTRDLLSLSNQTFELREFMMKVKAELLQQGEHLDNLTEKHWNKVTEHEERMAELRQLIANLTVNVTEKLGNLDTFFSTRLESIRNATQVNQANIQNLQAALNVPPSNDVSVTTTVASVTIASVTSAPDASTTGVSAATTPDLSSDGKQGDLTPINQTTPDDELEYLARFTEPKLVGELKDNSDLVAPRDVKIHGDLGFIVTSSNPGLSVVSLSDPAHPRVIGSVHNENMMAEARAVALSQESDHHAFVVASHSTSVTAIDISDPAQLRVVGSLQDGHALSGARAIAVSGGYAFVAGTYSHTLCVIDISRPAHMTLTGQYHDADDMQFPTSVAVLDHFVLVTSSTGHALVIVDVSNPTHPEKYSVVGDTPSMREARSVAIQGKYAYVASASPNTLSVVDLSDLKNPLLVSVVERVTADMASHVAVDCRFAYVASAYNDALTVIDIHEPRSPVYIGTLKDNSQLNGIETVAISGQYGVFVSPQSSATVVWQLPYYCDTPSPSGSQPVGEKAEETVAVPREPASEGSRQPEERAEATPVQPASSASDGSQQPAEEAKSAQEEAKASLGEPPQPHAYSKAPGEEGQASLALLHWPDAWDAKA